MKKIDQKILDYLKTQRIAVIAVETPDGSPHAATVHFAHSEEPLAFYFETNSESIKGKSILNKGKTRASLVIGSNEDFPATFQLDGEAILLESNEKETFSSIYLGKFPEKGEKVKDPKIINFKFVPRWWRFTSFADPSGKLILTSE